MTVLAARGFVAGLAVAVLAGCGGRPRTDLSITVSNAFGQHEYQLTCDPDGGDKILAEKLCALLNETPDVMLAGPTSSSCAGGLATVHLHVQGKFDGRSVDTANGIDSCSGNLEAEQLWLSGPTTSTTTSKLVAATSARARFSPGPAFGKSRDADAPS